MFFETKSMSAVMSVWTTPFSASHRVTLSIGSPKVLFIEVE